MTDLREVGCACGGTLKRSQKTGPRCTVCKGYTRFPLQPFDDNLWRCNNGSQHLKDWNHKKGTAIAVCKNCLPYYMAQTSPFRIEEQKLNQPAEQKKDSGGHSLKDYQAIIYRIADRLKKEFNCIGTDKKPFDILSCLSIHGGTCRDLVVNESKNAAKVINDVDFVVDTQRLQIHGSKCKNKDCKLRQRYESSKKECLEISKIRRIDRRLHAWVTSPNVINCNYLVSIIEKDDQRKVTEPNPKGLNMMPLKLLYKNGIDIDIVDMSYVKDYGYITEAIDVFEAVNTLYPWSWDENERLLQLRYWMYDQSKNDEISLKSMGLKLNLDVDIKNGFVEGSELVKELDRILPKLGKSNKSTSHWLNEYNRNPKHGWYKLKYQDNGNIKPQGQYDGTGAMDKFTDISEYDSKPPGIYPIKEHTMHTLCDCTFNSLFIRLSNIYKPDEVNKDNDESIARRWKDAVNKKAVDERDEKDDEKEEKHDINIGMNDLRKGVVSLYPSQTENICQSEYNRILYRAMKNAVKLLQIDDIKTIYFDKAFVDSVKKAYSRWISADLFARIPQMADKVAYKIFNQYGDKIDVEARLAAFRIFGFDKQIRAAMRSDYFTFVLEVNQKYCKVKGYQNLLKQIKKTKKVKAEAKGKEYKIIERKDIAKLNFQIPEKK